MTTETTARPGTTTRVDWEAVALLGVLPVGLLIFFLVVAAWSHGWKQGYNGAWATAREVEHARADHRKFYQERNGLWVEMTRPNDPRVYLTVAGDLATGALQIDDEGLSDADRQRIASWLLQRATTAREEAK